MSKEDSLLRRLSDEGGVVEVCVRSTTLRDWQAAVSGLRSAGYPMTFTVRETPAEFDVSAETFGKSFDAVYSLQVRVGTQVWATDFVDVGLIDFQCSPRPISNPVELRLLAEFMQNIARSVGKPVALVPESLHPEKVTPYAWVDVDGVFTLR